MKRILLAGFFGIVVLAVGSVAGLATLWLLAGTALAAGFGWMLGGMPSGPGSDAHTGGGNGGDGGE